MVELGSLVDRLKPFGTGTVSDALDVLGIKGALLGIRPVTGRNQLVGPAFTVRYVPVGYRGGTVGDFIEDVPQGSVVVIDNGARVHCSVWGDLMSNYALRAGIAGTVIDGVCRDIGPINEIGYTIFARGAFMSTGKDRVELAEVGGKIGVAGVQIEPGDIICGDETGLLAIPAARAFEVLDEAERIADAEDQIKSALKDGASLAEARRSAGYHSLQAQRTEPHVR